MLLTFNMHLFYLIVITELVWYVAYDFRCSLCCMHICICCISKIACCGRSQLQAYGFSAFELAFLTSSCDVSAAIQFLSYFLMHSPHFPSKRTMYHTIHIMCGKRVQKSKKWNLWLKYCGTVNFVNYFKVIRMPEKMPFERILQLSF